MKKYIIYDVTPDELDILEREGFEFISEIPYLGSKNYTVLLECDKEYFLMALNAIRRPIS
jgi:hypothetical protein